MLLCRDIAVSVGFDWSWVMRCGYGGDECWNSVIALMRVVQWRYFVVLVDDVRSEFVVTEKMVRNDSASRSRRAGIRVQTLS